MPVLSRDREEDVPECSGPGISRIFSGNIRFPGNGIRERRPLVEYLKMVAPLSEKNCVYHHTKFDAFSKEFPVNIILA